MLKEALVTAYEVYEEVLTIIYALADNDYVSASEFAQLINTILSENVVESKHINYILKDNKVIKNKSKYKLSENKGANRYYINENVKQSLIERKLFKELQDKDYKFFVWDGYFLFLLMGLDFRDSINSKDSLNFCKVMNRYVHKFFDTKLVLYRLELLQIILFKENAVS